MHTAAPGLQVRLESNDMTETNGGEMLQALEAIQALQAF